MQKHPLTSTALEDKTARIILHLQKCGPYLNMLFSKNIVKCNLVGFYLFIYLFIYLLFQYTLLQKLNALQSPTTVAKLNGTFD